ncbi:MAG: GNAT family N-acetyltransferase [Acidimicrobiales bacterium]
MAAERALIRTVAAEEIRPLRHRILRPTQRFGETVYPGDDLEDTVHFGAFDGERLVGIASLYREDRSGGPPGGWRLRGMATEADVRGAGFGAALVAACVEHVAASGGGELWCNARQVAVGFYRRAGFDVVSEEFDIPGIGPHVVMARS